MLRVSYLDEEVGASDNLRAIRMHCRVARKSQIRIHGRLYGTKHFIGRVIDRFHSTETTLTTKTVKK